MEERKKKVRTDGRGMIDAKHEYDNQAYNTKKGRRYCDYLLAESCDDFQLPTN